MRKDIMTYKTTQKDCQNFAIRVGGSAAAALPADGKSSLTLPNEVRDPIGNVVFDELAQRVLADETLRHNDVEPKLVTR
jgi:hypothetical protein